MKVERVSSCANDLGESPVWDDCGGLLWWVDITGRKLLCIDPSSQVERRWTMPGLTGAVVLSDTSALVVAQGDTLCTFTPELDSLPSLFLDHVREDRTTVRWNDAKADPHGQLWSGLMLMPPTEGSGVLYRIRHKVASGEVLKMGLPNGMDWDLTRERMYLVDSLAKTICVYAYTDGALGRLVRTIDMDRFPGMPDGLTLDADGNLWVAFWQGEAVRCFAPGGLLLAEVRLPVSQVTSCAFGGPDLSSLFITSARLDLPADRLAGEPLAGDLFCFRPGVTGRTANRVRLSSGTSMGGSDWSAGGPRCETTLT